MTSPALSGNNLTSICPAEVRNDTAPNVKISNFQSSKLTPTTFEFDLRTTTELCPRAYASPRSLPDDYQPLLYGNNELDVFPALPGNDSNSICPAVARSDSALLLNDDTFQPNSLRSKNQPVEHDTSISVYYQNVRGLRTKTDEFFVAVSDAQYDVIVLTETWLNECFYSAQLFGNAYTVYRNDRNPQKTGKNRGGGVLIAAATRLNSLLSPIRPSDSIEQLWVKIICPNRAICLGVVYISPDCAGNVVSIESHIDSACQQSNSLQPNDMHVIFGDYNQPHLSWIKCSSGYAFVDPSSSTLSPASVALLDGFAITGMRQMNTAVNSSNRTLDLVFVNDDAKEVCSLVEAHEPLIEADRYHPPLLLTLRTTLPSFEITAGINEYNFRRADFVALNQSLLSANWDELNDIEDVDLAVQFFSDRLKCSFQLHVPTSRQRMKPPWSNLRLRQLKRQRSAALRKYTNRRNPVTKHIFCLVSNEYRAYNRHLYSCYVKRTQDELRENPKRFWSFVNEKRKQHGLPSSMFLKNNVSDNNQTTCDLYARHFSSVFNTTSASVTQISEVLQNVPEGIIDFGHIEFCEADIKAGISKLKASSSVGPDGIPSIVLKKYVESLCAPLQKICNLSLQQNKFPEAWKRSFIFPVHKKGDKRNIENYRGITSLCAGSKLLEIIVGEVLFRETKSYISIEQHGFFPKRSINTNLLQFTSFCIRHMEESTQVDAVYTDLKAAFDRIDHLILLRKLKRLGASENFVCWLKTYLTNRYLSVKIGCTESFGFCNRSGVPQGSNLGPLLFLIFFNDVCFVIPPGCKLLYADDLKLFLAVRSVEDCRQLQDFVNRFAEWCFINNLTISVSKCSIITFTRSKAPIVYEYMIEGSQLERVTVVKDLGVELDTKLTFQHHYSSILSKANRNLGFIMRLAKNFRDPYCLRALYFSLVRSVLDTASVVWSPFSVSWSSRIETVQRKFIRHALRHLPWSDPVNLPPYEHRCKLLDIDTLDSRRKVSRAIFVAQVLKGEIDAPDILAMININVMPRPLRTRGFIRPAFHRTLYGQNEPVQAMCTVFNDVYDQFDFNISTQKFKSRIRNCFM